MNDNPLLLLILAIFPIIILATYVYKKDIHKESKKILISLFIGGIVSCILTLILTGILQNIIPFFARDISSLNLIEKLLYIFIEIALIEEFSKWLICYILSFNSKEFDETFDAIVYCGFVALGFAIFENILYVLQNGYTTGILRALTAVPGHLCFGVAMGYYFALAKESQIINNNNYKISYLLYSILFPTLLHGLYDYLIFSQIDLLSLLFYVFISILIVLSFYKISKLSKNNNLFNLNLKNNKIVTKCLSCNYESNGNYCPKCGKKLNK